MTAPAPTEPAAPGPQARFWTRYAAWSLDAACLLPLVALLGGPHMRVAGAQAAQAWASLSAALAGLFGDALASMRSPLAMAQALLADPRLAGAVHRLDAAIGELLLTPLLLYALLACLWSVGFEASAWRATPGKRALGLEVVDAQGRRLHHGGALLRFLAAGLSWLTCNLGHALALLPPRHLALHDLLSGTRVHGPARLPAWARGWLALQALASCIAAAWLFVAAQAAMQAALERALGGF